VTCGNKTVIAVFRAPLQPKPAISRAPNVGFATIIPNPYGAGSH